MPKINAILLLGLAAIVTSTSFAEEITLTTYYPAPYGVYREMRSQRMAIGDNYYDASAYCWQGTCTDAIGSAADLVVQGDVGIGTHNPSRRLTIAGSGGYGQAGAAAVGLENTGSSKAKWQWHVRDTGQAQLVDYTTAGITRFLASSGNATGYIFVDGTEGNVGIGGAGTFSPVNKLDVDGALAIGDNYAGTATAPANGLIVEGNVGIGAVSPRNKLDVDGALAIGDNYAGTATAPANGLLVQGDVGIGTDDPRAELDIVGQIHWRKTSGEKTMIGKLYGDANDTKIKAENNDLWFEVRRNSDNFEWYQGTNLLLKLSGDGNVTGKYGNYHIASDESLKKDIATIPNALDKVLALRGVNFKWIDTGVDEDLHMGMVAQEVEPIVPEVVHTNENTGLKAIEYQYLVGLLVEAIKELETKNDILKNENKKLEERIESIEEKLTFLQ